MATHSSVLAGESHGQRSLAGCSARGRKESAMAERPRALFPASGLLSRGLVKKSSVRPPPSPSGHGAFPLLNSDNV